jgi:SAM-dependent methyltransferase
MPAMDYAKVAEVYDAYARTDIDVPFFVGEARGCHEALELTSGTGRLSIPLIEAGVKLSCLDSSGEMLAVLRRKLAERGLTAPVYEMDMCSFELGLTFDLILIPFNSFAEIVERDAQEMALRTIRRHLTEGGKFICTFHNPAVRLMKVDGKKYPRGEFALPQGGSRLMLSSVERYDAQTQLVEGEQWYEIRGEDGGLKEEWSVGIRFFLHSRESFEGMAEEAGFRVVKVYGNYDRSEYDAGKSPFMIFVLE